MIVPLVGLIMSQPPSDLLGFAAVLLIGYPVVDYVVVSNLKRSSQPTKWFCAWTLGSEWLLTIAAVGLLVRHGLGLSDIGETLGRRVITIGFVAVGLILVAAVALYNRKRIAQLSPERLAKVLHRAGSPCPSIGGRTSIVHIRCVNRWALRRTPLPWVAVAIL